MTGRLDDNPTQEATKPDVDIVSVFAERQAERYVLHARYMNEMMVRVLQTIGYDVGFRSGTGQYLFDRAGVRYLDLLSGWGVFGIGRNHPRLRDARKSAADSRPPGMGGPPGGPAVGPAAANLESRDQDLEHFPPR